MIKVITETKIVITPEKSKSQYGAIPCVEIDLENGKFQGFRFIGYGNDTFGLYLNSHTKMGDIVDAVEMTEKFLEEIKKLI